MSAISTYKLINIVLIESHFKRQPEIHFKEEGYGNNININLENQTSENKLYITLTVDFKAGIKDAIDIEASVKMLGVFEYEESSTIPVSEFANINGPAIIFPFIREHLANCSVKAGMTPILLPPINFVKLQEDQDKEKIK